MRAIGCREVAKEVGITVMAIVGLVIFYLHLYKVMLKLCRLQHTHLIDSRIYESLVAESSSAAFHRESSTAQSRPVQVVVVVVVFSASLSRVQPLPHPSNPVSPNPLPYSANPVPPLLVPTFPFPKYGSMLPLLAV